MTLPAVILLLLVTGLRLGELVLANRNTRALKARGAVEVGAGHYPLIVLLHATWLAGLWVLGAGNAIRWPWLLVFVVLLGLRFWVLTTLGPRWTTRIIVLKDEPLVRRGPYRFIPHPNYAVVVGEIAVLPLALGLPLFAVVFSLLNAAVLAIRIRAENRALRAV